MHSGFVIAEIALALALEPNATAASAVALALMPTAVAPVPGLAVAPEPLWAVPPGRTLGVGGLAHGTGLKNVLLASRQVLPGLGLEGELAAGWGAARLILQKEKKRDLVKGAVLEG